MQKARKHVPSFAHIAWKCFTSQWDKCTQQLRTLLKLKGEYIVGLWLLVQSSNSRWLNHTTKHP